MPEEVGALVETRLAPLRDRFDDARWVPSRHLHLTLVFLGAVALRDVPQLGTVMDSVAARHDALEVALGGGSGITRRAEDGIAWLTMSAGAEAIVRLAEDLRQGLRVRPAAGQTLIEPPKSWRPHLTVARRASTALIKELRGLPKPVDPITWRAETVVLFRSHLGPPGARYEPIEVVRLLPRVT